MTVTDTDYQTDDYPNAWLCLCGNYELSGNHCEKCAHEPPWGCTCESCLEKYLDYDDEDIYWIETLGDEL